MGEENSPSNITIKSSHCPGNERRGAAAKNLPAKEDLYLLLSFYDTYTYYYIYRNELALCSGSPALLSIPQHKE